MGAPAALHTTMLAWIGIAVALTTVTAATIALEASGNSGALENAGARNAPVESIAGGSGDTDLEQGATARSALDDASTGGSTEAAREPPQGATLTSATLDESIAETSVAEDASSAPTISEPRELTAVPGPHPGEVVVTWQPPAVGTPRVYLVTRDVTFLGPGMQVATTAFPGFVDRTPVPGATYYYFVTAFDAEGEKAEAGPAMAVSQPGAPALPTPEMPSWLLVGGGLLALALLAMGRRSPPG